MRPDEFTPTITLVGVALLTGAAFAVAGYLGVRWWLR